MKKITLALTLLLFNLSGFGQNPDPVLIENLWYLSQITIETETYIASDFGAQPPLIFEDATSTYNVFIDDIDASGCLFPDVIFTEGPNTFQIPEFSNGCLDEPPCGTSEPSPCAEIYGYHAGFYFDYNTSPFGYTVLDNGDNTFTLITTNTNGDEARYDNYKTLGIEQFENLAVTVYPNPGTDELFFTLKNASIESITVFSAAGKKLTEPSPFNASVDISFLASGLYFLEITSNKGKTITKFIKQ